MGQVLARVTAMVCGAALIAGLTTSVAQADDQSQTSGQLGELTQAQCITDNALSGCTTADASVLGGSFGVTVSPDGNNVYVGGQTDNALVVFSRNRSTGALTWQQCFSNTAVSGCTTMPSAALAGPRQSAVSPDGKNFYITALDSDSLDVFSRDLDTGALTFDSCFSNSAISGCTMLSGVLDGARDLTMSNDGKNLYLTSETSRALVTFSRDVTTGELTKSSCLTNTFSLVCTSDLPLNGASGLVLSPDQTHLYVTSFNSDSVTVLDRTSGSGDLTFNSCITQAFFSGCSQASPAVIDGAISLDISPDGKQIYVVSSVSSTVVTFTTDPDDGHLTQAGCLSNSTLSGCTVGIGGSLSGARMIAVAPDGRDVYATSTGSANALTQFSRNDATGALSEVGCWSQGTINGCTRVSPAILPTPRELAISPEGWNIYVVSSGNPGNISTFDRSVPEPTVTSVDPRFGPIGGNTEVTVSGSGFVTGLTEISTGGGECTGIEVVSAQELTCHTSTHAPGAVDVDVQTPRGDGTLPAGFTYLAAPAIQAVEPEHGPVEGGYELRLTGSGFTNGVTSVAVAGNKCDGVNVISESELTCQVPASDGLTAGLRSVSVETPGGSVSASDAFRYTSAIAAVATQASSITTTRATLQGAVAPGGYPITQLQCRLTPSGQTSPVIIPAEAIGGLPTSPESVQTAVACPAHHLKPATSYNYTIEAIDCCGSGQSQSVQFTTAGLPPTPAIQSIDFTSSTKALVTTNTVTEGGILQARTRSAKPDSRWSRWRVGTTSSATIPVNLRRGTWLQVRAVLPIGASLPAKSFVQVNGLRIVRSRGDVPAQCRLPSLAQIQYRSSNRAQLSFSQRQPCAAIRLTSSTNQSASRWTRLTSDRWLSPKLKAGEKSIVALKAGPVYATVTLYPPR